MSVIPNLDGHVNNKSFNIFIGPRFHPHNFSSVTGCNLVYLSANPFNVCHTESYTSVEIYFSETINSDPCSTFERSNLFKI